MAIKILLVDDEMDVVRLTEENLVARGFEVVCAYDGLDGLNKAKEIRPDLILLDLFMPVIDGYEVCRKLNQDKELKDIPIILFSGGQESSKEVRDTGAVDIVSKPFDIEELVDKIRFYTEK